jgi:hypothetical protein
MKLTLTEDDGTVLDYVTVTDDEWAQALNRPTMAASLLSTLNPGPRPPQRAVSRASWDRGTRRSIPCRCGDYTATSTQDMDEHVEAMLSMGDIKDHGAK